MDIQINYNYRGCEIKELLDVERLVRLVLAQEGVRDTSEVALTFVDNDTICELNTTYRGINKPTDVLSFECDGAHGGEKGTDVDADFFCAAFPDDTPFELGDIFIAVDIAQAQAPSYGLSFAEETSLLIVHGLLHLLGYDHLTDVEAVAMETRETELLSLFWDTPFRRSRIASGIESRIEES